MKGIKGMKAMRGMTERLGIETQIGATCRSSIQSPPPLAPYALTLRVGMGYGGNLTK